MQLYHNPVFFVPQNRIERIEKLIRCPFRGGVKKENCVHSASQRLEDLDISFLCQKDLCVDQRLSYNLESSAN